ncbi:MAG: hypothetical protein V4644_00585 [Patescibacteria group bacterium]
MPILKKVLSAAQKPLILAFAAVFAVGSITFAQTFTQPTSAPPGGNVAAPVNVGGTFQEKVGALWARSMGTDDGYCIGDDCITQWPRDTLSSCQLCLSVVPDTSGDNSKARQCGNGGIATCVPIDQWTSPYRDDTDDRAGGCQMQWKLDCTAPYGDQPAPAPSTYTGSGNDETYTGGGASGGGGGNNDTLQQDQQF